MRKLFLVLACLSPATLFAAQYSGTSAGTAHVAPSTRPAETSSPILNPMSQYLGTVELTCTTLTAAGTGAHILDRDNTGIGQEAVRIDVTDGNGTLLYTLSYQNTLGSYSGGMIATTPYTTAPTANPIRFVLTSLAGNGFAEQIDVDVEGICGSLAVLGIPTASNWGLALLGAVLALLAVVVLRRRGSAVAVR